MPHTSLYLRSALVIHSTVKASAASAVILKLPAASQDLLARGILKFSTWSPLECNGNSQKAAETSKTALENTTDSFKMAMGRFKKSCQWRPSDAILRHLEASHVHFKGISAICGCHFGGLHCVLRTSAAGRLVTPPSNPI